MTWTAELGTTNAKMVEFMFQIKIYIYIETMYACTNIQYDKTSLNNNKEKEIFVETKRLFLFEENKKPQRHECTLTVSLYHTVNTIN